MLINDPKNRGWAIFVTIVTILALLWFSVESLQAAGRLPGRNPARFWLGVAGGLLCMSEMLIWPRKGLLRRWGQTFRLGRTQDWMRAHLWLGVLSIPLLVLHAGIFPWGGSLATVLMLLFLTVVVSGFWGLAMQQIIPKKMLLEVPGETIYSQIDFVSAQLRNEAHQIVLSTCESFATDADSKAPKKTVVSGKPNNAGFIIGYVAVEKTDVIREQFETQIARFICPDPIFQYYQKNPRDRPIQPPTAREQKSPLRDPREASIFFESLKLEVDKLAHPAVEKIAEICDRRRQFERQRQLHRRLHNWLAIHLPLSIVLIVLMWVHIIVSIRYIR